MIDLYLVSDNPERLAAFCQNFANVIGPAAGKAALAERIEEDGSIIPAQATAGDPDKVYACVRVDQPVDLPEAITSCAQDIGQSVVGAWA